MYLEFILLLGRGSEQERNQAFSGNVCIRVHDNVIGGLKKNGVYERRTFMLTKLLTHKDPIYLRSLCCSCEDSWVDFEPISNGVALKCSVN